MFAGIIFGVFLSFLALAVFAWFCREQTVDLNQSPPLVAPVQPLAPAAPIITIQPAALVPVHVSTPPRLPGVVLAIPAFGVPVFSDVLEDETVYRLTFSGTYDYGYPDIRFKADAVYGMSHNDLPYSEPYDGLRVDGQALRELDSWREDRSKHEYTCLFEGRGKRVRFALKPPHGGRGAGDLPVRIERVQACLKMAKTLELEYAEARSLAAAAEILATQQRQHEARTAMEMRQKAAKISGRVAELQRSVHQNRNMFDQDYRSHLLEQFRSRILTEWRESWVREYNELFGDGELVSALRTTAPEVLDWHERRIELILLAERLAMAPPDTSVLSNKRRLTSRTMNQVQHAIGELFRLREQIDAATEFQAVHGSDCNQRQQIEEAIRGITFQFDLLRAYGIAAKTPEEAEDKFLKLCPYQPRLASYDQIIEQINAGEQISPDGVKARLEDLFREEIILQAKRRRFVRVGRVGAREAMDERLFVVRREATFFRDFLKSINVSTDFPDYRQEEETREEQFFRLMQQKTTMTETAKQQGHPEYEEYIDSHIAQEVARLFEANDENYT